jgi:membrane protease subunit HflC
VRSAIGLVLLIILAIFAFSTSTIIVDETKQVVITEFGRPVKVIDKPGLHFKVPFIQSVTFFERRLLEYDSAPTDILTRDKKAMVVDNYARWKIVDPLKFLQAVGDERRAQTRLDDIIYSELRVELGRFDLSDIVAASREVVMANVTKRSDEIARQYGIQIVDVRIKRADLPTANQQAVYDRMRSERQRQATQYRSEGAEESQKIKAITDKEKTIILADAYKQAQITRGEGDAQAIKIYNEVLNQDPEFYRFVRTLDAYRKGLNGKTKLILTPDSEFLKYFKRTD